MIETKSGTRGGPQFSYNNSFSTSRVTGELDMLSPTEFRQVVSDFDQTLVPYLGNSATDWRGAVQRDAGGQEHAIGMAGSGQGMNYRLSLNYLEQDGVLRGSRTERTSAAINYNHRLFQDRLSLRASLRGARTQDQFTPGAVLGAATTFDPTQPITTPDGSWFERVDDRFSLAPNNPLAELALAVDEGTTYRGVGSLEGRYRMPFLDALSGTVRVGFDVGESERRGFRPSTLRGEIENRASCTREPGDDTPCRTGTVSRSNPSEVKGLVDAFLTYAGPLDRFDSDVEATAGYSYENFTGEYPFWVARGLDSDLLGTDGVPSAEEVTPDIDVINSKLASFFGRLNYTFRDRYLLTLSVRHDGSSKFGPENQWGTFPAAAVGWRIGEEAFMDRFEFLSDLKLRASWGVNGNQSIPAYLWVASYTYSDPFARVQFGDQFVSTIRPSAVDPGIKWEETTSFNVGFDYGLFDNRVTGSVEYYDKDTRDLLFSIPIPAGTNLSNRLLTNVGRVSNKGVELGLNALVLDGGDDGLRWDASFTASTNRNRLVSINPTAGSGQIKVGGIAGGVGSTIQVLRPGQPINSFFVFHHLRDSGGRPVNSDTNGDGSITALDMYEDVNKDGKINDDDLRVMHSPTPRWNLAHTSSLGFRRLDLSFTLRAALGSYVYNNVASSQGYLRVLNSASGPVNLHQSVLENGFVDPQFFSDIYLEDASFLRMDNITLGYGLPRLRGVSEARVFGTVQNAFTLTGYDGLDPESGLGGIDNNIYPRSRTFSVGVSLGF
jgi:iron complex outermembrane receptor protein